MDTLYDLFKKIIEKSSLWKYYNDKQLSFDVDSLDSGDQCRDFINKYLAAGDKATRPIVKNTIHDLDGARLCHIVSCFFLGLVIFHNSKAWRNRLLKGISQIDNLPDTVTVKHQFYYLWFLICFFHDLGYAFEDRKLDLNVYCKGKFPDTLLDEFSTKPSGIPEVFSKEVIKSYYQYRKNAPNEQGKTVDDHGIVGGLLMYSELCKYREEVIALHGKEVYRKLYWGEDVKRYFSLASWVIACHNIWFIHKADAAFTFYKAFHLEELVLDQHEYRIIPEKHPYLFFFDMVDTIEPIKRVCNLKDLKEIKMDIKKDNVSIIIDKKLAQCPLFDKYLGGVKGLDNWLTKVEQIDRDSLNYTIVHIN